MDEGSDIVGALGKVKEIVEVGEGSVLEIGGKTGEGVVGVEG